MSKIKNQKLYKLVIRFIYFELLITLFGILIDIIRITIFSHNLNIQSGLEKRFFTNIFIGLGWIVANISMSTNESRFIELKNDSSDEQILRIKDTLQTMKYKIVKEENGLIKFRLPFFYNPFDEVIIKILEKQIIVEGPYYVLKKVFKKINSI